MSLQYEAEERVGRPMRMRELEDMAKEDAAFAAASKGLPR